MYKFPLKIPPNRSVLITQGFKSTMMLDFYRERGWKMISHEAVDVACGTAVETYGTPVVCPFPHAQLHAFEFDKALGGKGSRFQVRFIDEFGTELIMGGLHCSELVKKSMYYEGDVIGYIGNNGSVLPAPSIGNPYAGSHLHLSLIVNGTPDDPLKYFDVKNPYRGPDTGHAKDAPAAHWAIALLIKIIEGITGKPINWSPPNPLPV